MKMYKKAEVEIIKDFPFGKGNQYKVMVITDKEGNNWLCWQNSIPSNWKVVVVLPSKEGNICTALFK